MRPDTRTPGRFLARFVNRNPERLWIHYGLAMFLFMGLVVATHTLNTLAVARNSATAEGIKNSNQQLLVSQEIIRLAESWDRSQDPEAMELLKAVAIFEGLSMSLVNDNMRIPAIAAHYIGGKDPLFAQIKEFVDLARKIAKAPPENGLALIRQLQAIYHTGGMHDGIVNASVLFADEIRREAQRFDALRDILLLAAVLVLLAEALLVFWPAQTAVRATIQKLRRQTAVLSASRARLREMNARLEHIVRHDPLTGLPNRHSLLEALEDAIRRRSLDDLRLYILGLDDFKSVNDVIGSAHGDLLLIKVGQRLRACVDDEDTVAHMGDDRFALVSAEEQASMIGRMQAEIREPFDINGRRVPINASIGHVIIGREVRNPQDIIGDAETALQFAKTCGGGCAQEFNDSLRHDLNALHQLQMEIPDAIQNGEIEPWFQPQIRLSDGRLHGAEVLARWRHPIHGILMPDTFFPAAERAGMIIDLDHAIWRSAMMHAQTWERSALWHPSISLNAAPDTIADPNLIERFLLMLQRSGLQSDQIVVEVLETTLIKGQDDMAAINIDSLAECGIALELDDFGTGYASLSKLTQLPLAGIKLDRSLIAPLPDQAADTVLCAILALAAELGLKVVAEGIEQKGQAIHLGQRGCYVGQGYGFGRPMSPDDFTAWLAKHANSPSDLMQQEGAPRRRA